MVPNHAFYQLNYIPIVVCQWVDSNHRSRKAPDLQSGPNYRIRNTGIISKNILRRRKDSNFHGLIHGQFITPDRSTLLCLPLHHDLHISEHLVGFEPTMTFRMGFCRPLPSTTRPQVHFNQFGRDSNPCFLASRL